MFFLEQLLLPAFKKFWADAKLLVQWNIIYVPAICEEFKQKKPLIQAAAVIAQRSER